VGVGGPCLFRTAVTDDGAHLDERGPGSLISSGDQSLVYSGQIVTVVYSQNLPAVCFETRLHILGESQTGTAFDADLVVSLSRHAFHEIAVGHYAVGEVIDHSVAGPVEGGRQEGLGHGHAYPVREAGSQGPGGGVDTRSKPILGVTGSPAAPLTEVFQLFDREPKTGKVEQGVEQHRSVSPAEHEPIPVRPSRVGGIELEMPGPQNVGHRSRSQRHPGVAGVGLLNGIDGESTDSGDRQFVKVAAHSQSLWEFVSHVYISFV